MRRNSYNNNGRQPERSPGRDYPLYPGSIGSSLSNLHPTEKRMETKLYLWILNGTGWAAYAGAILLNVPSWKSDILFAIAILFGAFKLYFFVIKERQQARQRELEIKKKIKDLEQNIWG